MPPPFRLLLAILACFLLASCASRWPLADRRRQNAMLPPEQNLPAEYRNDDLSRGDSLWTLLTQRKSEYGDTVRLGLDPQRNLLTVTLLRKGREIDRWSAHYSVVDSHLRLLAQHRLRLKIIPPMVGDAATNLRLARISNRLVVDHAVSGVGLVGAMPAVGGTSVRECNYPLASSPPLLFWQ